MTTPEFDACTPIKVFDLLTVTVMVEQCDPDLTVVTYWAVTNVVHDESRIVQKAHCLKCLLQLASSMRIGDGRGMLIKAVKAGTFQIVSINPREPGWKCPRCEDIPTVNLDWRNYV